MWWRFFLFSTLALASAVPLAADMRESAWQARELLGPDRWARVVWIENSRDPSPSAAVYALVFELEDRLWFYAENHGTESLSVYRDHVEQDKADLGPLLRTINPDFVHYEIVPETPRRSGRARRPASLPDGCFIESVAQLRLMVEAGRAPDTARLLAYYGINGRRGGHTVLYYEQDGQRFYYDPSGAPVPVPISAKVQPDPLAIARVAAPASLRQRPARAAFFPLHVPLATNPDWADRGPAVASNYDTARESTVSAFAN